MRQDARPSVEMVTKSFAVLLGTDISHYTVFPVKKWRRTVNAGAKYLSFPS